MHERCLHHASEATGGSPDCMIIMALLAQTQFPHVMPIEDTIIVPILPDGGALPSSSLIYPLLLPPTAPARRSPPLAHPPPRALRADAERWDFSPD
jgi:hypothetical protein